MNRLTARRANPQVGTCVDSHGFDAHHSKTLLNTPPATLVRGYAVWSPPCDHSMLQYAWASTDNGPKLDRGRTSGAVGRRAHKILVCAGAKAQRCS